MLLNFGLSILFYEVILFHDTMLYNKYMYVITRKFFFFKTGKGKGTPALRNGIHCNQVDEEEDSDAMTDWQGFD